MDLNYINTQSTKEERLDKSDTCSYKEGGFRHYNRECITKLKIESTELNH